jgi:Fe-S cluster assembly iron-binding protein IscA
VDSGFSCFFRVLSFVFARLLFGMVIAYPKGCKEGDNVLTVTERAKERLWKTLKQETKDPGKAIRLILAPSPVAPFGFIVDDPEEGDHVIQAEDGSRVLLLGPAVRAALNDSVIDYRETCMGLAFTLARMGPVN